MKLWIKIIAGVIPAAAAGLLLICILISRRRRRRQRQLISPQTITDFANTTAKSKFDNEHTTSINKINLSYKSGINTRSSLRFHHLNHKTSSSRWPQLPAAAPFKWDDHPHLIADATENGWQSFVFSNPVSDRQQLSSLLWPLCGPCSPVTGSNFPAGSSDFMQSVRLNPSPNKPAHDLSSFSCIRTNLPLPGPALGAGGGSFPQEAYFEITVVFIQQHPISSAGNRYMDRYSDRSKLVGENPNISLISEAQKSNFASAEGRSVNLAAALGLTNRASLSSPSMPGTYPGSIGFFSDGSLHLDGRMLVSESEKAEWAAVNRVIGCGFDPRKKKVFFTVGSQLSHVMRCSSEEYSSPLFPVLAANVELSVVVNLGQAPFKYAPANVSRTPNPCFLRLLAGEEGGEHTVGSVDSRELFSVARMETVGAGHGHERSKMNNGSFDDLVDAESDLFEISLQ
ncbi:hypothetical protein KSP40_PGU017061 [Platanthera guangdongensis]|uniref:SPRY domain-containing protein n=1 Tax=Platanthera guangdongensis TaxID=2320717 RepID=A0ABR2MUU9_9ASPA